MRQRRDYLARLVTLEMGKLLREAREEVDLSADILDYYADNAERFLAPKEPHVDQGEAWVESAPLGVIFCIEPWNFPYYQLVRVVGPNLMLGNTLVVKHGPSVPQCALAFERLLLDAGAPLGVYTNVFVSNEQAAKIIVAPRILSTQPIDLSCFSDRHFWHGDDDKAGMEAVCRTEHFSELIESNPANRARLMALEPERFIGIMEEWRRAFNEGAHHPVIGLSPAELRSMTMPACIIPGNDRVDPRGPGQAAHRLMPNSEYHEVFAEDRMDVDVAFEDWEKKEGLLAAIFVDFLRRQQRR
jgi:Aldehyde dehydrogenase family